MSNDNTTTWKGLFGQAINKLAGANLNPIAAVKDHVDNRESKPKPFGQRQAEESMKEARAQMDHAKSVAKVYKKVDFVCEEIDGLCDFILKLEGDPEWVEKIRNTKQILRDAVGDIAS